MRHGTRYAAFVIASALSGVTLAGCGGGGHGFSVAANPVHFVSNALPAKSSGEEVNFPIPFTGGSGGPYILTVVAGSLPPGIETDNATVALVGRLLEDGVYDFTLQLTDTGSSPFSTTVLAFHWDVPKGALVFATDPVLDAMVFNQFVSVTLVVAGGTAPYSCDVVDDPDNDFDEPLPTGLGIPDPSCTIVGSPTGVKPTSPFIYKVSIRATDSTPPASGGPLTTIQEFTLTILVPPVIITTTSMPDGVCGTPYNAQINIADGIPPFRHTIVSAVGSHDVLRGALPSLNALPKGDPLSAYAPDNTPGPYSGKFPEGLVLAFGPVNGPGVISGTPRRTGTFNSWVYHVQSNTLPDAPSQNQWKTYSFAMADSVPPAFLLNPSVLKPGNTFSSATNFLDDASAGAPYSKQFIATSGVPYDGFSDAPSSADRVVDPTEPGGQYNWSHLIAPIASLGDVGMQFTIRGELRGNGPSKEVGPDKTGFLTLTVIAADVQLPGPILPTHQASGTCRFSIGPDNVVISEGLAAHTSTAAEINWAPVGTYNHVSFEYNDQTVGMFEPFPVAPVVRALAAGDLTRPADALPVPTTLDVLLANVDMQPITVNPTWWAYDCYNLNSRGARALQHSDLQRENMGQGYNSDSSGNASMSYANTPGMDTWERNGDAAIELPDASNVPGVAIGTAGTGVNTGIYANGGQLRAFDGASYFGFFIVRKNGKIEVPFAFEKAVAPNFVGFGDSVLTSNRNASSVFRRLQVSVSPDGRFLAAKLKTTVDNFIETVPTQKILLMSLTGEKVFDGTTFRTVTTGGAGTTADGQFLYGDSLTLTNRALYFLKGNLAGTGNNVAVIYSQHWVYRLDDITNSASTPSLLAPAFGGAGGWTNNTSQPLSTAYHRWGSPGATALSNGGTQAVTTGMTSFSTNGNPTKMAPDFYAYQWANFAENSSAPHPIRVSANGSTVAIVAADGFNAGGAHLTATVGFQRYGIYTDFFDSGSATFKFRSVTTTRRHYTGGTRLAGCRAGDFTTRLYNWYQGPATQLELSDDGKVVGAVYNAATNTWTTSGAANMQNSLSTSRENLSVISGTGAADDPFATISELQVTEARFTGGINWRFGGLAFTRNASTGVGALVFWGGNSLSNPLGYDQTASQASHMSGTLFQWALDPTATVKLSGILATSQGGTGTPNYTSSPNSSVPGTWSDIGRGSIQPVGYFISNDGRFVYYESISPLTDSGTWAYNGQFTQPPRDDTAGRLVGVNIFDTSTTINTKAPLSGFAVAPWPTDPASRGFGPRGGPTSTWDPNAMFSYASGNSNQRVQQMVSGFGTNGNVFFAGYQQNNMWGSTVDGSTSFSGGGPTNATAWNDASDRSGEILAFNANVGGGVTNLSNFGNAQINQSISRYMSYLQPSLSGKFLAFVMSSSNTTSWALGFSDREQIHVITNVNFNSTGALTGAPSRFAIEGSNGRAGPSMAWDFTETKLYYAFTASSSNENTMVLKEASLNAGGTGVASTRTQPTGIAGTAARFAVLHAGR